jgi:hypothetical protein
VSRVPRLARLTSDQLRLQGLGHFSIREHLLYLARPNVISYTLFLQLFAYMAFAAASLLIVLRVYVPDADGQPPKARHLKESWQN